MPESRLLARVILRSDAGIHIAFRDVRSVYATAENLLALFSDPIEFIDRTSKSFESSAFEINRDRVELEDILGLTLASVNADKQIICEFPELFRCLFATMNGEESRSGRLDMKSFEFESVLSDEKSYLLRYYLEFTGKIKPGITIKNNIRLRDEIKFQILREVLNAYFDNDEPKTSAAIRLSEKIAAAEPGVMYPPDQTPQMVSPAEYARILDCSPYTVNRYLREGLIKSAVKQPNGRYLINSADRPIDWDKRKGRKRKSPKTENGVHYKRKSTASAADVCEHILKCKLFTEAVAPYIRTFDELDYYTSKSYHEIVINGKPCLVVDVNPDFISTATGQSNRELMAAGQAPVFPSRDRQEFEFHLHHVGQTSKGNFPICVIPRFDHNSPKFSAALHPGSSAEELHTPEFDALRKNFWRSFLAEYDKADGKFNAIPYLNHKQDRGYKR